MSPDQGHGCYCGPDEKCEVCRPETPAFDPEYDTPLYHCSECGRELRRDSCRKCGTENNPASNWIPNGKKQRPAPPPAPRDEAHASGGLEAAIKRGIHRADKHADDDPLTETQRDRVAYHVEQAVREALSEIIDWDRSGVPER